MADINKITTAITALDRDVKINELIDRVNNIGNGHKIGEYIISSLPINDAGLHLLDGALLDGSSSNADFVDYIDNLYTNATKYTNIKAVGSLTTTGNVLSNFSTSNYAQLPLTFNPSSSNTWEIVFKFTTGSTFTNSQAIFARTVNDYYGIVMLVTDSANIYAGVASGSTTIIGELTGDTTLSANTTYYTKLEYTGSAYKLYLSTDGETYTLEGSITSSTPIISATTESIIGIQTTSLGRPFTGSIDLNESYINIDGSRWWTGAQPIPFTDEPQWQAEVTTYGVCGKFVYDNVNNTVRLPKITGILEGTNTLAELGNLTLAGLPQHTHTKGTMNITGTIGVGALDGYTWNAPTNDPTGAFTFAYSSQYVTAGTNTVGPAQYGAGIALNAAQAWTGETSTANYTNALVLTNTVQPQTIKAYYYIVVATGTKTEVEVDIDEIVTDLNGKADTDLTNITNTAKIAISRNALISSTYISLSVGASGTSYTAPSNGLVYFRGRSNVADGQIWVGNSTCGYNKSVRSYGTYVNSLCLLIKKGDTFAIAYDGSISDSDLRFYYSVGSESEI